MLWKTPPLKNEWKKCLNQSLDELEQWHHDDIFLILGLGHIRITNDIRTTITYSYLQIGIINSGMHTQVNMRWTQRGMVLGGCWKEDTQQKYQQINWCKLFEGRLKFVLFQFIVQYTLKCNPGQTKFIKDSYDKLYSDILRRYFKLILWSCFMICWRSYSQFLVDSERHIASINLKTLLSYRAKNVII